MAIATKRDFERMAWKINCSTMNEASKLVVVDFLCDIYREINPRFNEQKFREACGV